MTKPQTFSELLDLAVLSNTQRLELCVLHAFNPIEAGIRIGCIIFGQQLLCLMAAEEDKS